MPGTTERVYFDSHMHTPLCKHALGDPVEYAAVGFERGLRGIVFTCHCPMPEGFWPRVRMAPEEFDRYVELVAEAAEVFAPHGFEVRLGIESDWFPGFEGWIERLHGRADFHHCLGSVHFFGPEYQERFWRGDFDRFRRLYFEHLAESAETGLFDTLSHPDLIKNADAPTWDFEAVRDCVASSLDRIAATGVAMELNTSGAHKRIPEMNPGLPMLAMMRERGIPVVIGSDAHHPARVGEGFGEALALLRGAGYDSVSYFDARRRIDVPIEQVAASLAG